MEQASDGIRIVVLNGSVRPGNYTRMAFALVVEELRKDPQVSVDVISPGGALPPPGTGLDSAATEDLQSRVLRAAGVVLATPEYRGSFSSVMKLMIENLGFPSVLAGKTVALIGIDRGDQVARAPARSCVACREPVGLPPLECVPSVDSGENPPRRTGERAARHPGRIELTSRPACPPDTAIAVCQQAARLLLWRGSNGSSSHEWPSGNSTDGVMNILA